jgi:hypothetical protein
VQYDPEKQQGFSYTQDSAGQHQSQVYANAVKRANKYSSAVIYKFLSGKMDARKRQLFNISHTISSNKNRYISEFSSHVLSNLKRVNLDLIVSLNVPGEAARVGTAVEHWPHFKAADEESILVF